MTNVELAKETVSTNWHAGSPMVGAIPDGATLDEVRYDSTRDEVTQAVETEIQQLEEVGEDTDV